MKDIGSNIKVEQVVLAQESSVDRSLTIDTAGYGSVTLLFEVGAPGITLSSVNKITARITHGDDSNALVDAVEADVYYPAQTPTTTNDAAGIGAAGAVATFDADAKASTIVVMNYIGQKRYVKGRFHFEGTHGTATPISCTALLGDPTLSPVG